MSESTHLSPTLQGAVPLTDWGVLRARGNDTLSFLNGQLTQDFARLPIGEARLSGYCSAKGRLLATFVAWCSGENEVLLACSADLLAPTLKRLSMFVLRAKCKLDDASAEIKLFGLAGAAATQWLGGDGPAAAWQVREHAGASVIRLPDAEGIDRYLLAGANESAVAGMPAINSESWRWLEVRAGVPRITASTAEQFVPQMINLELVGGVNFQKGCFPGQEIVARSQYRGTLKRRMFLFETDAATAPGAEIFHSEDPGQPAGLVVNAAANPGSGSSLLAELKLAALGTGSLHLASPDGPALRALPLPYPLPDPAPA